MRCWIFFATSRKDIIYRENMTSASFDICVTNRRLGCAIKDGY